MTISLTIKTLDSQNHSIGDVDEESTVKEFKEKISPAVGIAADLQRLIYCGRVLKDEKKIKDYALDGKVVHLVQRPPPTGGPDRLAASEAQARSRGASPSPRIRRHNIIHHIAPPPSQPSALVRLDLAKRMLNAASTLIDRLENGNNVAAPATPSSGGDQTSTSSSSSQGAEGNAGVGLPQTLTMGGIPLGAGVHLSPEMSISVSGGPGGNLPAGASSGLAQAASAAVTAAISGMLPGVHEMSMSFTMGPDGQFVLQQPPREGGSQGSQGSQSSSQQRSDNASPQAQGSASRSGTTTTRRAQISHPPPTLLAGVMTQYRRVQERLDPFWTRLTQVLTDDPTLNSDQSAEHQRLFVRVTEVMHFMSHAQHAMSDTVLNLANPPPRQLRARPFVVPMISSPVHSVLQAVPATRGPRSSSASRANLTTSGRPAVTAATRPSSEADQMETGDESVSSNSSTVGVGHTVEVVVGPVVVGIEMETGNGGSNNNILLQAFGNMGGLNLGRPPASTTVSSSSTTSSETSAQNSRSRATETQPTTSTRTRLSTQVNAAPMGPPLGLPFESFPPTSGNFDMLLPCNSHHIPANREAYRRSRQAASQDRRRSSSVPPSSRGGQIPIVRGPGGRMYVPPPPFPPPFPPPPLVQAMSREGGLVLNVRPPPGEGHGSLSAGARMNNLGLESSLSGLLAGLSQGVEGDTGMASVISGIVRQVFAAMTGGEGGNQGQTIAAFLESMPDYNYRQGEDLITDLLMCLARHLTFGDLVGILTASNAVIGRMQEPLQQFMRQRLNLNSNSEARDIEQAIDHLIDEHYPSLENTLSTANVNQGVDFPESIVSFMSHRLSGLAVFIWHSAPETFASGFYDICQKFLYDATHLGLHCFSDGQASLERLLRNHLSNMDDLGSSSISSWTLSTAMGHLRTYTAGLGELDSSSVERYVVSTEDGEKRRQARKARKLNDAKEMDENDDAFMTPRSSPEAMEIGSDDDSKVEKKRELPDLAPMANGPPAFPESLLAHGAMGPDMVIGREPWHRDIPSDWVPVVAKDVQVQQSSVSGPAPPSDAYLSIQPAKRRKIAEARKPGGDIKTVIEDTLQDAMKATGVKPSTSESAAAAALSGSAEVQEGVAEHAKKSLRNRIQKDRDMIQEKYPNCKDFSNTS